MPGIERGDWERINKVVAEVHDGLEGKKVTDFVAKLRSNGFKTIEVVQR